MGKIKQPKGNELNQLRVNTSKTENIKKGASYRVREALHLANKYKLPFDSVLVLGPQHGYELQEYKRLGVDYLGVEVVKSFVDDCKDLGLNCIYCSAENFVSKKKFDGLHASHVLEHCYDIETVAANINRYVKHWCYISVPITPEGEELDPADFTRFTGPKDLLKRFPDWKEVEVISRTKTTFTVFIARC